MSTDCFGRRIGADGSGGAASEATGAAGLRAHCSGHGGRGAGLAAGDEEGEGGRGAGPGAGDEEVEHGVQQRLRLREGRKGRDKGGECGSHWNLLKNYNLF